MTISSRGPRNILVLDRTNVPMLEICDAVAEHRTFDWIKTRYPVNNDEIFQCIETFVDVTKPSKKDKLELRAVPSYDTESEFDIETAAITDRIYFLILSYAKAMIPLCEDIEDLFRYGLELIINEALTDIKNGHRNFENSEIHSIVFKAFEKMHLENHDLTINSIDDILKQFKISTDVEQALKNDKS